MEREGVCENSERKEKMSSERPKLPVAPIALTANSFICALYKKIKTTEHGTLQQRKKIKDDATWNTTRK